MDEGITAIHHGNGLDAFELKNRNGMRVTILNYGATIAKLEIPDREGNAADVLLGHDDLSHFIGGRFYFGGTIGRFANRIADGRFILDGKTCQVSVNNKGNLLHGGASGFDKKFWAAHIRHDSIDPAVELALISPDRDEGFPGTVQVKVIYTVTENNELKIGYTAETDSPTVINLTNHAYFNLTGDSAKTILDHVLTINGTKFTPISSRSIPTGEIENVEGTPMDFRKPSVIGARIDKHYAQLELGKGYDHNWVINNYNGSVREAATVYEPTTGRLMEVLTDQPGLQFYSGNYLDGTVKGKKGIPCGKRSGLCLECQQYPNSPNIANFPSVVLRPGRAYKQNTVYKFSINELHPEQ